MKTAEQNRKEEAGILIQSFFAILMVVLSVYLAYTIGELCYQALSSISMGMPAI
ncbi:hypothetical protein [Robertkochia flava]|uniref:hypothetical protein n=1 Tax=Robertkochia flava TaxID=3447986 RepID=UPI001CCAC66F|nr:hypothetical protein [Robertkochia marina]